ncbi:hypothetical protein GCM10027449_25250 [Sinomonas notoginsengisoli]|uniref:hypothetical protein n=1 Tax=Sinomonas notoginsengisoli TaxID=1457311 RepID=UPI001F3664B7|nr:hypothetical protein [Sinomonas notoginsengisoli]
MFRKTLAALGVAAALTLVPTTAHALDCTNLSKPPYAGSEYIEAAPGLLVHLQGNWAFLKAPWAPDGYWTFVPPGTIPLAPGANGNYQNGEGFALLFNAHCDSKGQVLAKRQTTNGVQLMSGCSEAPH